MTVKLYFKEEQKERLLQNLGYKVSEVQVWTSYNEYQGKMSYEDSNIKIAIKNNVDPQDYHDKEKREVEDKVGFNNVFERLANYTLMRLIVKNIGT